MNPYYIRRRLMMNSYSESIPGFFDFKYFLQSDTGLSGVTPRYPAFVIDGVNQDVLHIGRFISSVSGSSTTPITAKNQTPTINVSFNNALTRCANLGTGYHLMTYLEWAAIAWWCLISNFGGGITPLGNNNYGKDTTETQYIAIPKATDSQGRTTLTGTGTGPSTWNHNRLQYGISDLNGNTYEWVSGIRLFNGELQIIANNNAANSANSQSADSNLWRAYRGTTGNEERVVPTTNNGGKDSNGNFTGETSGCLRLNWDVTNSRWQWTTGSITNRVSSATSCSFATVTCDSTVSNDAKQWLQTRCLLPIPGGTYDYGSDVFVAINGQNSGGVKEFMMRKSGSYSNGVGAGIFDTWLTYTRTNTGTTTGFRVAHYGSV